MDKNGKTILNGRYEIIRPIGYGGMAEVFLAHDQLLDRNGCKNAARPVLGG